MEYINCLVINTEKGEFDDVLCAEGNQTITIVKPSRWDNEKPQQCTHEVSMLLAESLSVGDYISIKL